MHLRNSGIYGMLFTVESTFCVLDVWFTVARRVVLTNSNLF